MKQESKNTDPLPETSLAERRRWPLVIALVILGGVAIFGLSACFCYGPGYGYGGYGYGGHHHHYGGGGGYCY